MNQNSQTRHRGGWGGNFGQHGTNPQNSFKHDLHHVTPPFEPPIQNPQPLPSNYTKYTHKSEPYPQNQQLATDIFYFTLHRLEKYLERYFTRYYDFYIYEEQLEEAAAISNNAVHRLAQELQTQHQMEQAAVMVMCYNYSRISLPQAAAAKEKLKVWAEYLYAHLDPSTVPAAGQQRYEEQLMAQAHTSAEELWLAFREFSKDPLGWGNKWAAQQALQVYEQLEKFGDAAHRQWLLENQPHRVPPTKPISQLRPEAESFIFLPRSHATQPHPEKLSNTSKSGTRALVKRENSDSGYDSPAASNPTAENNSQTVFEENFVTHPHSPDISTGQSQAQNQPLEEQPTKFTVNGDLLEAPLSAKDNPRLSIAQDTEVQIIKTEELAKITTSAKPGSLGTHIRRLSIDSAQCFNKTIIMFTRLKDDIPVTALFDTGAEGVNWVSKELVTQLGLELDIWECASSKKTPGLLDASGNAIRASQSIELSWKWLSNDRYGHQKWRTSNFYILPPRSDHIQVLFGTDYIREHKLVQFNEPAPLAPLTANQALTSSMSQRISENKKARDAKKNSGKNEQSKPSTDQKGHTKAVNDNMKSSKARDRHS